MEKVFLTEHIHPDAVAYLRENFEVVQGTSTESGEIIRQAQARPPFQARPFQGKMASSPRPGYGSPRYKNKPRLLSGRRGSSKLGGRRSVLPRQRPYCITFTGTSGARRTIPSMMTCSPALSSPSTTLMSPASKRMFTLR